MVQLLPDLPLGLSPIGSMGCLTKPSFPPSSPRSGALTEIVAVAAAAGGRKEVRLGRVWLPCLLWAALSGDGAGRGEGNQGQAGKSCRPGSE